MDQNKIAEFNVKLGALLKEYGFRLQIEQPKIVLAPAEVPAPMPVKTNKSKINKTKKKK